MNRLKKDNFKNCSKCKKKLRRDEKNFRFKSFKICKKKINVVGPFENVIRKNILNKNEYNLLN